LESSLDTLNIQELPALIGQPMEVAESILAALDFALTASCRTGTRLVVSAVAAPDNLAGVDLVREYALERRLGSKISLERTLA